MGMPNYPGYTPGLIHPGLTAGPTPFVPPNHLPTFQPKVLAFLAPYLYAIMHKVPNDTRRWLKQIKNVNTLWFKNFEALRMCQFGGVLTCVVEPSSCLRHANVH
jgi:hypothetical protein